MSRPVEAYLDLVQLDPNYRVHYPDHRRTGANGGALDELVARERLDAFAPLTAGGLSVNKRLDRVRHGVGLLRGPFEARNG